ncbi:MAG TPA: HAD family hydrolase [Mobilitalea sp.]|nr:HAD family hydrolase [Mobilitalea sp.]
MKKLFISDLDGTLLHPNVQLSRRTITILNDLIDQGVNFTIATARSIASVKSILKEVSINLPIILMNGVCVYDLGKEEYLNVETFSKDSTALLMSIIASQKLKGFAYTMKDGEMSTYYEDLSNKALQNFYEERVKLYKKPFTKVDDFASLAEEPLIYFTLMDLKENLDPIYPLLENAMDLNCVMYKDNYSPDMWYLEIFSKKASKYHATEYLRSYLGADSIVCFGDNRNDFSLFEASDYKIAVANAVPELKEKADLIVDRNAADGVALWLKFNALKG